ncbi:MAG TPA: hypothetical protein PKZ29_00830 [Candidatus Woesebacteria bacterium]|jgi:hypothetical protein|nr:hypothetical protein [Candidatus Woesebacteria bacterium]HOG37448.1 hypothetical protein [Candidatus Woesebacteria bacterium]
MSTCAIIPEHDLTSYQEFGGLETGIATFTKWVDIRDQMTRPLRRQTLNQDLLKFSDQLVLDGADRKDLNRIAGWTD